MDSLLRPLDAISILPRAITPACYTLSRTNVLTNNPTFKPCGGSSDTGAFCCSQEDICLEDAICHFPHYEPGASGYYVGGCTDPTFKDPACSRQCTEFPKPDITYDGNSNEWACCFTDPNSSLDCSNPGNHTFQAPALTALSAAPSYVLSTSSSQTSATATATTTNGTPSSSFLPAPAAASTVTQTSAQSEGLSTGAKIGIAIPLALIGLALIATAILLLQRRRRRGRLYTTYPPPGEAVPMYYSSPAKSAPSLLLVSSEYPRITSELGTETQSELDGREPVELQARS